MAMIGRRKTIFWGIVLLILNIIALVLWIIGISISGLLNADDQELYQWGMAGTDFDNRSGPWVFYFVTVIVVALFMMLFLLLRMFSHSRLWAYLHAVFTFMLFGFIVSAVLLFVRYIRAGGCAKYDTNDQEQNCVGGNWTYAIALYWLVLLSFHLPYALMLLWKKVKTTKTTTVHTAPGTATTRV